jgi:hypothetical protein
MPSIRLQDLNIYVPFADVVKTTVQVDGVSHPARILRGVMTSERLDQDDQVVDYAWAKDATERWFGSWANIREQHGQNAVGKGQRVEFDDAAKAIWLTSKVVDPVAILKIDEGILQGYSVGMKGVSVYEDLAAPKGRIGRKGAGGSIVETSIVDHPCNTDCKFAIAKSAGADAGADAVPGLLADLTAQDDVLLAEASATRLPPMSAGSSGPAYQLKDSGPRALDGRPVAQDLDLAQRHVDAQRAAADGRPRYAAPITLRPGDLSPDEAIWLGRGMTLEEARAHVAQEKAAAAAVVVVVKACPGDCCGDCGSTCPGDCCSACGLALAATADVRKDGAYAQTPVLIGTGEVHNATLADLLAGLKALIGQELAEPTDEWGDIACLTRIASELSDWAWSEACEEGAQMAWGEAVSLAVKVQDPSERRSALSTIEKALSARKEIRSAMEDQTAQVAAPAAPPPPPAAATPPPAPPAAAAAEAEPIAKGVASIQSIIDWGSANGMPHDLQQGLMALAHVDSSSTPTADSGALGTQGENPTAVGDSGQPVGQSAVATPTPLNLNDYRVAPPVTAADSPKGLTADEVRALIASSLSEVLTSDSFVAKLAGAQTAQTQAAEAIDIAKAAASTVDTRLAEATEQIKAATAGAIAELREVVTAAAAAGDEKAVSATERVRLELQREIDRIKTLPQAARAVTSEAGAVATHVVEKVSAANPAPPPPAPHDGKGLSPAQVADLIARASAGDIHAAKSVQAHFRSAGTDGRQAAEALAARYRAGAAA